MPPPDHTSTNPIGPALAAAWATAQVFQLAVTPEQWNANHSVLGTAMTSLKTSQADLKTALADAKAIVADLKA